MQLIFVYLITSDLAELTYQFLFLEGLLDSLGLFASFLKDSFIRYRIYHCQFSQLMKNVAPLPVGPCGFW